MSQTQPRYQRSTGGLIGAMIVAVLAVLAYVGFRALVSDNKPVPVATVDYASWVASGRADGKLHVWVPVPLPNGARPTSASYQTGTQPHWHLGLYTSAGKYVGVEESLDTTASTVAQYVDKNATQGPSVTVGGQRWQVWTDSGGDYALLRTMRAVRSGDEETLLVGGDAPASLVRAVAASLRD